MGRLEQEEGRFDVLLDNPEHVEQAAYLQLYVTKVPTARLQLQKLHLQVSIAENTSLVHLVDALFHGFNGTLQSVIGGKIGAPVQPLEPLLETRHQPFLIVGVGLLLDTFLLFKLIFPFAFLVELVIAADLARLTVDLHVIKCFLIFLGPQIELVFV